MDYIYKGREHFKLDQYEEEIKDLFKGAGLKDKRLPFQELRDNNLLASGQMSVWENMASDRSEIITSIKRFFNNAIGEYSRRYKQAFNPLFWIEFVINLPKHIFKYLGAIPESLGGKIINLVYWTILLIVIILEIMGFDIVEILDKIK